MHICMYIYSHVPMKMECLDIRGNCVLDVISRGQNIIKIITFKKRYHLQILQVLQCVSHLR